MQPWLDLSERETGCRRCGRVLGDDVRIWACRERTRRLETPSGGPARVRYDEVSRAYPVCGACHDALDRGAAMGSAALRRLLLVVGSLTLLALAAGPAAHRWEPNFTAAFFRNGAFGR